MALPSTTRVLVFSVDEDTSPALARIAVRRAWPLLRVSHALQGLREVRHRRPRVVIVQVSLRFGEGLDLVRLLPAEMMSGSLIAVATSHRDDIERAVRAVGATCYLPTATNSDLVERTVSEMLDRLMDTPLALHRRNGALVKNRRLSSFFPIPAKSHGRRA